MGRMEILLLQRTAAVSAGTTFVETMVASGLNRAKAHTVKLTMDFVDGPRNDVREGVRRRHATPHRHQLGGLFSLVHGVRRRDWF